MFRPYILAVFEQLYNMCGVFWGCRGVGGTGDLVITVVFLLFLFFYISIYCTTSLITDYKNT